MVRKKRRAGGGRKPNPNKKVMFSTRLEPEVAARLKAAATKWPGKNVSALTERLISDGLRELEDRTRDPTLRALNYWIGQLAEHISGGFYVPSGMGRAESLTAWRTDLYRFRAF